MPPEPQRDSVLVALKEGARFAPADARQGAAHNPPIEIRLLEVDTAVASRDSRLISGVGERVPAEAHIPAGGCSRLDLRASSPNRDRRAKVILAGEQSQDLCSSRTERAVPRAVLGERWRRKRGLLIWEPVLAQDALRALVRASPGS